MREIRLVFSDNAYKRVRSSHMAKALAFQGVAGSITDAAFAKVFVAMDAGDEEVIIRVREDLTAEELAEFEENDRRTR